MVGRQERSSLPPHSRKEEVMNRKWVPILIAAAVLLVASLACGTSNTGEKVGSTPAASQPAATQAASGPAATQVATQAPAPTQAPVQVQTYKVGDMVKVQDHTIVLNSAKVDGGALVANFTIDNPGSTELNVSSVMSFDAKDSEGTKLDQDIMNCPSGSLDGKVLAGDKLKGNICWKVAGGTKGIRIYYTASLLGTGAVVWAVDSGTGGSAAVAQPTAKPAATQAPANSAQAQTYKIGDVVKVQDHTIVLNSAKVDGGALVANFTIDNPGSTELNVSSVMSFDAKDSEGTKLDQDIMNCPSGSLDGKVLGGDKLKGNICWTSPSGVTGIRIYYSASLLGSGAVVWSAN
jgi:Domain of unknown function (DUF4352)